MNKDHWAVSPDPPRALRPGYLAALAGVLSLVLVVFATYELRASRRVIRRAMEEGTAALIEAVARAGENALRADSEIEMLAAERLLNNARLIRELEVRQGESSKFKCNKYNSLLRLDCRTKL